MRTGKLAVVLNFLKVDYSITTMYILPKIHKDSSNPTVRPIIAGVASLIHLY